MAKNPIGGTPKTETMIQITRLDFPMYPARTRRRLHQQEVRKARMKTPIERCFAEVNSTPSMDKHIDATIKAKVARKQVRTR